MKKSSLILAVMMLFGMFTLLASDVGIPKVDFSKKTEINNPSIFTPVFDVSDGSIQVLFSVNQSPVATYSLQEVLVSPGPLLPEVSLLYIKSNAGNDYQNQYKDWKPSNEFDFSMNKLL